MNYDEIKKLIDDMGKADFEELNIEFPDGVKISMKKNNGTSCAMPRAEVTAVTSSNLVIPSASVEVNNIKTDDLKVISSPMVGTFYESSSPTAKPFVKLGDKVKKGQVVCIIEAMKLMNEIESEFDGEIAEICVKNEGVVEYGMPLFKIK